MKHFLEQNSVSTEMRTLRRLTLVKPLPDPKDPPGGGSILQLLPRLRSLASTRERGGIESVVKFSLYIYWN